MEVAVAVGRLSEVEFKLDDVPIITNQSLSVSSGKCEISILGLPNCVGRDKIAVI